MGFDDSSNVVSYGCDLTFNVVWFAQDSPVGIVEVIHIHLLVTVYK